MTNRMLRAVAAVSVLATGGPALAVPPDFQAKADAYLKSWYPDSGPGAAVIVTEGGKTVYARGRGLADIEAKRPITPDTVFRLGSITKQFAAATVLQLAQEGKLSLDDPLSKFLPDYPQPGASSTVRQLLNHTSGVQSYTGIPGWMVEENTNRRYSTAELINVFKTIPSPSKPGEKWDYNNSGYVLVGAVIEAVTGRPWHQEVADRFARPLKLASLRYGVGEEKIPGMAKGYREKDDRPAPALKIDMSVPHAAGALVGSVKDLAAWANALHHGTVLPQPLYQQMITPTALADGKTEPYGFGIGLGEVRGRKQIGHGGGIFGFSTNSLYIPEKDLFVAVFANSEDPPVSSSMAATKLAALAIGEPFAEFQTVAFDEKQIEPLLGLYKIDGEETERRFFLRDGQLYTQRTGGPQSKVYYAGNNRFHYGPMSLNWFEMKTSAAGKPVMAMHQNGAEKAELSSRIGPVPADIAFDVPRATLERYAGDYAMGAMTLAIRLGDDGKLTAQLTGQKPFALRATSATEFAVDEVGAKVEFKEEGGLITTAIIHQRGRSMPAKRVTK